MAINLLNTQNEADRRVYDILSRKFELFDGVFGASDIALGTLENGISFERMVLDIYQSCSTRGEFKKAFDRLDRKLEARRDKKAKQLRTLLLTESADAKGMSLEKTKAAIAQYLSEVHYWEQFAEPEVGRETCYWRIDNWGVENFGGHGTLFIGAFCDSVKILFPVLLLCDENGEYIDFSEQDIVGALERADDSDVRYFTPTEEENAKFRTIYDRLLTEMHHRYLASMKPVMDYNRRKVDNWVGIQTEQLNLQIADMLHDIETLEAQEAAAKDFLEKVDIRKKVAEKRQQLQKFQESFHEKVTAIQTEAAQEIRAFNENCDINPVLFVNIVLKF